MNIIDKMSEYKRRLYLRYITGNIGFVRETNDAIICYVKEDKIDNGILMDLSSGKILYEKNMDEKRYPASLTKVLTAIVVLENCKLDDIATVSYDSVMTLSSRICYSKFTSW